MEFMEPIRPLRKADEWLKVLKQRVTLLSGLLVERCPSDTIPPCIIDLYSRLDIRAILEQPLDYNCQDNVDEASFADALANFDAILADARAQRTITLVAALRAQSESPDAITEADLDRPTSLFTCSNNDCAPRNAMIAATALTHRCEKTHHHYLRSKRMGMTEWKITDPLERMQYVSRSVQVCGGPATFQVDVYAAACATIVVQLVAIRPLCTITDLDGLDIWFSCSCPQCGDSRGFHSTKPAMTWRQLVSL
jgi:hypothetical protein